MALPTLPCVASPDTAISYPKENALSNLPNTIGDDDGGESDRGPASRWSVISEALRLVRDVVFAPTREALGRLLVLGLIGGGIVVVVDGGPIPVPDQLPTSVSTSA